MRNIFSASLVAVLMIGLAATPASALTLEEIQSQIKDLLTRVASLTAQMNALQTQGGGVGTVPAIPQGVVSSSGYAHRVCTLLNRNLSRGMSGDDVRGIQEFLRQKGFLNAEPTGYFGQLTAQAVAEWQAKENLTQAGAIGPLSRERIKIWCAGDLPNEGRFSASPTHGAAPLNVLFETSLPGFRVASTYYVIDFGDGSSERAVDCYAPADACLSPGQNKHTYGQNGTYTAVLNKVIDPCGANPMCKAAIHSIPVAKQQIVVGPISCTKEYKPVCGAKQVVCIAAPCNPIQQTYSNRCLMNADGASFLYEGECRGDWTAPGNDPQCKVWSDGCNTCSRQYPGGPGMCTMMACALGSDLKPYCKERFGSTSNRPPTISGFSGPTSLNVNTSGTWLVQASDPEGGQLSYAITWGDEGNVYPYAAAESMQRAYVQNTSFTHAYAYAGTYMVSIVVRDDTGQEAKTTSTVKVENTPVACTMEYAPVCGKPAWCLYAKFNTSGSEWITHECNIGTTYSNRCSLNAAGAEFSHEGVCTPTTGVVCTADAYQCPDGTWVGRTGAQCQFVCSTSGTGTTVNGANSCSYAGASYQHDSLNTTGPGGVWLPQRCCNGVWRSSLGNLVGAPACSSPLWPQNQ